LLGYYHQNLLLKGYLGYTALLVRQELYHFTECKRNNRKQEGTGGGTLIQAKRDVHEESQDDACVVFKVWSPLLVNVKQSLLAIKKQGIVARYLLTKEARMIRCLLVLTL